MDTAKLLNDVHTIMDQIRLFTQQISVHSSSAADVIIQSNNIDITDSLPAKLETLKYITDTSCRLSSHAEEKIEDWLAMVCELVETCIQSKAVSEDEKEEAVVAYECARKMIENTDTKRHKVIETMKNFEK